MPRLIWVFAGRTGHFAGFVMRRLISAWLNRARKFFLAYPTRFSVIFIRSAYFCLIPGGVRRPHAWRHRSRTQHFLIENVIFQGKIDKIMHIQAWRALWRRTVTLVTDLSICTSQPFKILIFFHIRQGFLLFSPVLTNLILHTLIWPVE